METSTRSTFLTLPHEILVELLLLIPTSSIINFYSVNSTHLKLFDDQHGLWEQLARKIFQWGALETPVQGRYSSIIENNSQSVTKWKKEFRIASYIQERLHNAIFVATYREKYVSIDGNSIKGLHPPVIEQNPSEEICYDAIIQSDTILYPHPIGDFSTAYVEVKIIKKVNPYTPDNNEARDDVCTIGGALEGILSVPGTARSSFAITAIPDVFLECDFTPLHELTRPLDADDYMGFGINFVKNTVFFTVNGNIVHEASTNIANLPIQNLKNLHATISVLRDEVSVNMGSRPFVFDLLMYQQQNRAELKTPLKLFSEIIVPHLISIPDEEYMKDDKGPKVGYFSTDHYFPKPPFSLPSFFYLLSYGVKHPDTTIRVEQQDYAGMEYFRMILNSLGVFYKLTPGKDTIQAEHLLKPIEEFVKQRYPDYLSHPWVERVTMVQNVLEPLYLQQCIRLVELHRDELASLIYSNTPESVVALAHYEYFVHHRPEVEGGHWLEEVLLRILDPESICQNRDELMHYCLINFLKIRISGWAIIMKQQAGKHLQAKLKLHETMKKISCNDSLIAERLSTTIRQLNSEAKLLLRLKPSPFEHLYIQLLLQQVQEALKNPKYKASPQLHAKFNEFIIYGIFKLKISPYNYSSKEEYFEQVIKENQKMITKDLEKSYLESLIKNPQSISTQDALITLRNYFKLEFDQKNTVEDLIAMIEGKIEQYNNHDFKNGKSFWSTFSQTRTKLFGAAAVGLLGVAIGTFVIMKLRAKK